MSARLRIVDLGSGPRVGYASRLLACYGADVVKVEHPDGGDSTRRSGPFPGDEPHENRSGLAVFLDAGKRSVCLNVDHPKGVTLLERLLAGADVVIDEMSVARAESLGLDSVSLDGRWPRLIRVSITPFGLSGPLRDFNAPALILEALCGWLHLSGEPGRTPARIRGEMASAIVPGLYAAAGALAALRWRDQHGEGQLVEVSAQESMLACSRFYETTYAQRGIEFGRLGPRLYPTYGYKACQDGWAAVCAATLEQRQMTAFLSEMAEHADDPLFTETDERADESPLREQFDSWFSSQRRSDVFDRAQELRIPAGYVALPEDILTMPHLLARNALAEHHCGDLAPMQFPGSPFAMAETAFAAGPAPELGAHTRDVLGGELGIAGAELDALQSEGVIA